MLSGSVMDITAWYSTGEKNEFARRMVMKPAAAKISRFENILFATDFSTAALHAVPYLTALAKHYGSSVVVLHACPPAVNPMTQPATWPAEIAAAKAAIERHREELRSAFAGIKTDIFIEEGDLQSLLNAAIQEKNIDLLVIGTRGRTGLGKLLLGSVAEQVFRSVTCPVLTVGPHSVAPTAEFRNIVFATDFTRESKSAAAYAISLARQFHVHLAVLHVVPEKQAEDLVSWFDTYAACKKLLAELIPEDAEGYGKPAYFVERGDPAEQILRLADRREAGLLILGAQPQKGVPGAATHLPFAIAHRVVCNAKCPVLTVRNK